MLAILSDLHISNALPYSYAAEDGITDRIRDIILFFKRLRTELLPADAVLVLGDIFDRRRLDAVTIKVGTRLFSDLASRKKVIVLPGNHDTEDAAGKHNTAQYLEDKGCHVLRHGETFEIDGVTFHAFPYLATKAFIDMVKASPLADGANVALIHQAVKGARQGGLPFPSQIPADIFDRFDLTIGGHVHHRQRVGKVSFVGSTWNIDFREANEVSGYHLFTPGSLELEFVSSAMPRFHVFEREAGDFGRDDYVIVRDPEEEPKGRARLLMSKKTEERAARSRLELTSDRFTWEEAIAAYVKATAPEGLDASKLSTLGLRLLGDPTTSRGLPGLVTFRSIEAEDFMCFEGFSLPLDTPGATLILGRNLCTAAATSNGSGKTSIFRALTWALYGRILEDKPVIRKRAKKTNSFTDFNAAGEFLAEHGYASRGRIVAHGGSAGGMLMGAVANMAPDLFLGIIAEVPFVDVLTTMLDASLPLTPPEWPEWGNPIESETDYRTIAAYSPYDNVRAETYPHILALAGLTDPRVTYWEPAKWVAKLRELGTGDPLILLRTNMEAGHAGASGRFERLKEVALAYAFALKIAEA
jgi:DNA repair exonuclease SbcCD nuclease subunit